MAFHEAAALWEIALLLFVLVAIAAVVVPRWARARQHRKRKRLLRALGERSGSRAIALVHQPKAGGLIGRPLYDLIDVEDAAALLRALRNAGDRPVDLVLHTPGGMYTPALQIARALRAHRAPTRVLVPHFAMSGGTLIALGADEIVMDDHAILGPVDPQVGDLLRGVHSVAGWLDVARAKGHDADDSTLVLSHVSRRLLDETRRNVLALVDGKVADPERLVERLVHGELAHAYPLSADELRELGLAVSTDLPEEARRLLATFRSRKRDAVLTG